jgi:hypothetical protein
LVSTPLKLCLCLLVLLAPLRAQDQGQSQVASKTPVERLEGRFIKNLVIDQKQIWTSPFRLKQKDLAWLMPSSVLVGETIHRDAYLYSRLHFGGVGDGTASRRVSDLGFVGMGGIVAGTYLIGKWRGNDHLRETGILGTEALANAMAVSYGLKYTLGRERPFSGNGRGEFFAGGESFPSTHAIGVWAMATVVAQEYPGWLTKVGAYGLATTVSVARVTGRQHFPTDVIVGSALGYGIGKLVYRNHHEPILPGSAFGTFVSERDEPNRPSRLSSPIVPLDSWVYEAFDRLAGLGAIDSDFSGSRPWTRMECVRLLQEAHGIQGSAERQSEAAAEILTDLDREFATEVDIISQNQPNRYIKAESLYTRIIGIHGQTITDGYHFTESISNDFGRQNAEGVNTVFGGAAQAVFDRWSFYVRGEFQHSPARPQPPAAATAAFASDIGVPVFPVGSVGTLDRMRFVEAYGAYQAGGWQIAIGKQNLWWSPARFGAFMFSNNAEAPLMLRISRTSPLVLPEFLSWLGPMKAELFLGQLAGHQFTRTTRGTFGPGLERQPLFEGLRLTFKPTPNLEFGVSVTGVFGADGVPLNGRTFLRSLGVSNTVPGQPSDPGDRRSGFDFKYRVPGLRKWLTVYNDSFTEDEFSPIGYPRRSAMAPGIYLSQLPRLRRMSVRAEGFYTDLPGLRPTGFYYSNNHYLSGYTNYGVILGHWVGRQGSGFQTEATYAFQPRKQLSAGFRHFRQNPDLFGGGKLQATYLRGRWTLGNVEASAAINFENLDFPLLGIPGWNVQSRVELRYQLPFTKRIK